MQVMHNMVNSRGFGSVFSVKPVLDLSWAWPIIYLINQ
jgi:hypothetical protein